MTRPRDRRRRERRELFPAFRVLTFSAGAIAIVALLASAWLAVDAIRAKAHLDRAARQLDVLEVAVLGGDDAQADAALVEMQREADAAVRAAHGPVWWMAGRVPGIGPTVQAVQTVTAVVDDIAVDALPLLADVGAAVDVRALAPRGGRIDIEPLVAATPAVMASDEVMQRSAARVAEIDLAAVLPVARAPVGSFQQMVDRAASRTATAALAARLLPPMLGGTGPRHYLLMVQGNSEIRSTGGFPGALLLITADDGRIELERHIASKYFQFDEPVLPLTAEEEALYTERMAVSIYGTTITPDFPRAAELAAAMWQRRTGQEVDGVLSVDPVALERVLARTGPVRTASGVELTGGNTAHLLLNEIYVEVLDSDAHDAFFEEASRAVFDALISEGSDAGAVIPALAASAAEGRVLVWSAHEAEQDLLADTVLSGALRGEDDGAPVVGVYLNDGSMAKISYYLDYSVRAERTACRSDGRRELTLTIDMASVAPADAATLPPYVAGLGRRVPPGTARTNVAVYAPAQGWIEEVQVDGEPAGVAAHTHDGLALVVRTVDLGPGEAVTLEVVVVTGLDQPQEARLRVTPGSRPAEHLVLDSPCAP